MVSLASSGKRVVRLKSGDPMIFGRAAEEIAALQRAGIAVEVVPGVTAAQGAAASLKVSLTHRHHARRVQFITGHAHDGEVPKDLDLQALADPNATIAVYMPRATLGLLCERLVAAGAAPDRPANLVANATRPDETVIRGTLATLPLLVQGSSVAGPSLLLIGSALQSQAAVAHENPGAVAQLSP
jgi:uroporphyrin-III C-methyltransferase/precorrin-2 dehydrogenase/sirohydrochlorin ferrochelatase